MLDLHKLNITELSSILVQANKEYIQALKEQRPHTELLDRYQEIKAIHQEIETIRAKLK